MTRTNVADRLELAVTAATKICPQLAGRRISPHTWRHTTAMLLLQAGVDLMVIALCLGHESPVTTHGYVEADIVMRNVPNDSTTARAIDYAPQEVPLWDSLKRWFAFVRYVSDGMVPIDNNWIENQIRPIALGRKNWLFAGSLRAGKRAAAIMSLI